MKKYSVVAFLGLVSQTFFAWGDGVQVFRNDCETDCGDEFGSLAEAWEVIPNDYQGEQCVVIRLESNQQLSATLNSENFTANVTVDLNGYVISNAKPDSFDGPFFALHHSSDYTFTIKDGSAGGEDKYFEKKTRAPWKWDEYGSGGESFRGGVITGARGSAVSVNNGSTCTIRNVNFIGNSCGKSDGRGDGGAIKVNHGAYLNLYDVKFYGNVCAGRGGAVGVYTDEGNADNRVHAMIQGCTFKNNYAAEEGGAIMVGCSVGIKSTVVQDNLAGLNAGGVCVLRSFGTVFNSDGCSSDPGGDDIRVKQQSLRAVRLKDAGFWGDISTDDLSGQEADEPMLIVFERVIITGNFAEKLYDYARETTCQDASGENYPSDVYLFRASQDESLSRRYVGAIKVWQGTEPTFRIGIRLSRVLYDGDDMDSSLDRDLFTVDHPDHASYLDGEEKCFFANQSSNPNAAGYDERYRIVYVPENGYRYRLVCGDTVGTDVYFYKDEDGNGTLYGEGATWGTNNWPTATQHPLESYRHTLKTLTIEEGVSRLGSGSFRGFDKLETVTASGDLVGLGDYAFWQCPSLTNVTLKTTQEVSIGVNAYPLQMQKGVEPQANWVQFVFEPYTTGDDHPSFTNFNNYTFYYLPTNETDAIDLTNVVQGVCSNLMVYTIPLEETEIGSFTALTNEFLSVSELGQYTFLAYGATLDPASSYVGLVVFDDGTNRAVRVFGNTAARSDGGKVSFGCVYPYEDRSGVSAWEVPERAAFDVTLTWGEHIAEVSYTIGGETVVVDDLDAGAITIEVLEPGTVVTVAATAKDWYKVTSGTGRVTIDEDGKTVEITTETIGSLEELGIENLGDVSVEDAREWADEKELTPADIAACDFAYDAYLMNCGLDDKPVLKIVGIEEVEGGWKIMLKSVAGEADIDLGNINGTIKVKAAATLDELKDAEAIAYDIDVREEGCDIKVVGDNKNFMKAMVTK